MPRTTDFKPATYNRLTSLTKARFEALKLTIAEIQEQPNVVSSLQQRTLKGYASEIQRRFDDFESNVNRALAYDEEDAVTDEKLATDQSEISNLYAHLMSAISEIVGSNVNANEQTDQLAKTTNPVDSCAVRLPKIELSKFNGDYASWTTFINLFNTTIHNNPALSKVIKFQYLISVLSGEALNLVRNLTLTEANYDVAYNILTDRYQHDRRLQLLHINRVLDLPDISSKNVTGIRHFLNSYTENVQALTAIKCDITGSNPFLVAVLLRKLDLELRKRLETMRDVIAPNNHSLPSVSEIIEFLNKECNKHEDAICSLGTRKQESNVSPNRVKSNNPRSSGHKDFVASASSNTSQSVKCGCCGATDHRTYACPTFLSKGPQERFKLIKLRQLCISCLGMHDLKACKSQSTCKICHKRHNTLLHFPSDKLVSSSDQVTVNLQSSAHKSVHDGTTKKDQQSKSESVAICSHNSDTSGNKQVTVLLGTVLVNVRTDTGNVHTFRALLDTGSMSTLITERAVNLLNAKRHTCNVQIVGINQHVSNNKGQIYGTIETLTRIPVIKNHAMVILDKLTTRLPRVPIAREVIQIAQQYQLADPNFHSPNRIDVILGVAICPHIFTGLHIQLGPDLPHIIQSQFGHIVMGTSPCVSTTSSASDHTTSLSTCFHSTLSDNLHDAIQQFWVQENVPMHNKQSQEDDACERLFSETHKRDDNGRYIVRLPFKDSHPVLGLSRTNAEIRLKAMERKFSANEGFASLYRDFMSEYITLEHMTECNDPTSTDLHYYLPHHGVLKESSSTTKLRTVFDASCKSSSGFSLNDLLMTGTKLQTNIADLLIQFRRHHTVICCDIKQMYRQILIHPNDRKFQLILWRSNANQPIKSFQLNTVTYGVSSSPYLAIRTLHQLAIDEGHNFPDASHALLHHTYVDDIITGADSVSAAIELQRQLQELLQSGGFELRKWVSNSNQLLQHMPDDHRELPKFISNSNIPHFTVLGLHWSPSTDSFSYTGKGIKLSQTTTKRTVLSAIAQIYDPCGFLAPFIMLAKCFMQFIWALGLSWDTSLSPEVQDQWTRIISDTHCLPQISIPRSLNLNSSHKIELHGFCDASERGYAGAIYFRNESPDHKVTINLIMAKSRVAPLKKVTVPRLELCAAHLLSKLVSHVISLFPNVIKPENIWLWSDSTVTLTWIRTPPYRLKTYVANRVAQIQEVTSPELWHHVASLDNPADCASRGLPLTQLTNHTLWWNGPSWLSRPTTDWPSAKLDSIPDNQILELKADPLPIFVTTPIEEWPVLTSYSSWTKLVRIIAWILRFIHNCKTKFHQTGHLTVAELNSAKLKIYYSVQKTVFHKEFNELVQGKVPTNLRHLNPLIDSHHLIRVGGRLRYSSLSYDAKHPVLLPKRHHVVNILIDSFHLKGLHAGPQLVQALLTQEVWILNARNVIRLRIHKCLICHRLRNNNETPLMSDLPAVRTSPAKPFSSTGVDYCGPFPVKVVNLRFCKIVKVYLCILICMVTKAIHIEVVTDLTTDAFIAALTRFISRRGRCTDIFSDCGTNFVGADAALRKIVKTTITDPKSQSEIQSFTSNLSIKFHFNAPSAPHHGGLWERAVRSVKHHLVRVMGTTIFTVPELMTLTTRIEAMLNSRPLTPMSNDPNDLNVLTPGHFLTGAPLVALPETNLTSVPSNRLKQWQVVQQYTQRIWKRWSLEYLHTLQQRVKWTSNRRNLKIGDLVLMKTASTALLWPRARVIETFPGSDKIVRVVKIQTQDGIYVRPVTQLCFLPINEEN